MDEVHQKSTFRNRLIFKLEIGFISNFVLINVGIRKEKKSAFRNRLIHRGGGGSDNKWNVPYAKLLIKSF